jgi:S-disulfanyl-L-cysteine oxidoreductase SoxD
MKLAAVFATSLAAGLALWHTALPVTAQSVRSAADGVYTEAQAGRGEALYREHCENCHGAELAGTEFAPAIGGGDFTARWRTRTAGELFDLVRTTMPLSSPGGLSAQQNADLLAFLLRQGRFPSGKTELPARSEVLNQIRLRVAP